MEDFTILLIVVVLSVAGCMGYETYTSHVEAMARIQSGQCHQEWRDHDNNGHDVWIACKGK